MLTVSNEQQIRLLLYSFTVGAVLALLYCPFRVRRRLSGKRQLWGLTVAEDMVFCGICTVIYTVFIYCANLGIPRFYSALAVVLGFALCHLSIAELMCRFLCFFLIKLWHLSNTVFKALLVPLKKILVILSKIAKRILCKITISWENLKKHFIFLKERIIIGTSIRSGKYIPNLPKGDRNVKKLAITTAFLALVIFVSVPIFNLQAEIGELDKRNAELEEQIEKTKDKIDNANDKLERLEEGDEELLREQARENGYYDPNEELIYNDVLD